MNQEPEEFTLPEVSPQTGPARGFVVGLLGAGVLLGFSIGLLVTGYEIGGGSGSRPLFDEDVVTELFDNASPAIVEISVALNPRGSGSAPEDSG